MPKGVYKRSEKCNEAHKGWHHSAESNEKNRQAHLGTKLPSVSEWLRKRIGLLNPLFGRKSLKQSENMKARWAAGYTLPWTGKKRPEISEQESGEKHWNWQGGKSFEPYGPEFNKALKEQIRERDNYQCQECSIFQSDLDYKLPVHHIDFNKKNNDPINLISLCRSCHSQTNYGREDWIDYYKEKVK